MNFCKHTWLMVKQNVGRIWRNGVTLSLDWAAFHDQSATSMPARVARNKNRAVQYTKTTSIKDNYTLCVNVNRQAPLA